MVEVTVRRDQADPNQPDGKLKMAFDGVVEPSALELVAKATAFVEARDVALVLDYSGSMNYDSQFRSATLEKLGQAAIEENLEDIWNDLESPTYGVLQFETDYATVSKAPGRRQVDGIQCGSHVQPNCRLGLLGIHQRQRRVCQRRDSWTSHHLPRRWHDQETLATPSRRELGFLLLL